MFFISFLRSSQYLQHERFTAKKHGYMAKRLWDISLSLSGNMAVTGHEYNGRTFIDLFVRHNSGSKDKFKLSYSLNFDKYSDHNLRYVSFLKGIASELLVTCIGDKVEILDTKNKLQVLKSCRVHGKIRCLAIREGEIFVGFYKSHTITVFNDDLKETNKVSLKELKEGDFPRDLQVATYTVFLCTVYGRALSAGVLGGSFATEYTDTTGKYGRANSIKVSEALGFVAVVWGGEWGESRIIVYSLDANKSFLVVDVDSNVLRIGIADKDNLIITGNYSTGEIRTYDLVS